MFVKDRVEHLVRFSYFVQRERGDRRSRLRGSAPWAKFGVIVKLFADLLQEWVQIQLGTVVIGNGVPRDEVDFARHQPVTQSRRWLCSRRHVQANDLKVVIAIFFRHVQHVCLGRRDIRDGNHRAAQNKEFHGSAFEELQDRGSVFCFAVGTSSSNSLRAVAGVGCRNSSVELSRSLAEEFSSGVSALMPCVNATYRTPR